MNNVISAQELFEKNKRFDLIYKILYLKHMNGTKGEQDFFQKIYLEHLKYFNNFYEEDPPKNCEEDFIDSFQNLYHEITANGFDDQYAIPVNRQLQLYDGAHRLSVGVVLSKNVPVILKEHKDIYDYNFFQKKKMKKELADLGALEYISQNRKSYIVQIFPIVPYGYDQKIVQILQQYGFVYYKKSFHINQNGIINVKKINYGKEDWAGDIHNGFAGLRKHALMCCGYRKMRVLIFVAEQLEDVISAKKKIREMLHMGNYPVHINDTREEAIKLANIYFNKNALDWINATPFDIQYKQISEYEQQYNSFCIEKKIAPEKCAMTGSMVMALYGLRTAKDIDLVHTNDISFDEWKDISSHITEKDFYSLDFETMIWNPKEHMIIDNIKFISIYNIIKMKKKRREFPKDYKDLYQMVIVRNIRKIMAYIKTISVYKLEQIYFRTKSRR